MTLKQQFAAKINEDNAFEICMGLTRKLFYAARDFRLAAGTPKAAAARSHLDAVRGARVAALEIYEELFGEDELDDTLDACDTLYNELSGVPS